MPEPREKLETLYEEWAQGDYSRSDIFDPEMVMETFGMAEPMRSGRRLSGECGAPSIGRAVVRWTGVKARAAALRWKPQAPICGRFATA